MLSVDLFEKMVEILIVLFFGIILAKSEIEVVGVCKSKVLGHIG